MAKFLTTAGNSYHIEEIIIKAQKNLTLVTPYLKLSKNLIERLFDADKKEIKITLIYGKNELRDTERRKIEDLKNIEIYFCQNLHAKCYHNENNLIITSMNLYEFSERNNREMGLLIQKATDQEIYRDTLAEIESIKNASEKKKDFVLEPKDNHNSNNRDRSGSYERVSEENHPPFSQLHDFHLPKIKELIEEKYADYSVALSDPIRINSFPNKMVNMSVNGIIVFEFSNERYYQDLQNSSKPILREKLPGVRLYWNSSGLKIYPPNRFKVNLNEAGKKQKVDLFMKIIDDVYIECNKYFA